jgi:hypothetical protein
MRFMIVRKADQDTEAGAMPSERLIADMMKYNEAMVKAGVMMAGEGLKPSSLGARIRFSGGRPTVDGNGAVELELRQVFEAEDFGPAFTPELRATEERLRAELDARAKGARPS